VSGAHNDSAVGQPWWRDRRLLAPLGVLAGVLVWQTVALPPQAAVMAGIATWMACWWLTEAVPIPVTGLLPLVLLPSFGISKLSDVGAAYGEPVIFLFLGGFLLALGLEETGLHRRIALGIVRRVGDRPRRVVLGFMLASAFASMWISNTATAMVMLPIAMSVLGDRARRGEGDVAADESRPERRFGAAVMLGIAYACSIGGMATLVGTAPNLVLVATMKTIFPDAPAIGFAQWMLFGLPLAIAFLFGGWLLLIGPIFRVPSAFGALASGEGDAATITQEPGPLSRDEWVVAAIFTSVALLWVTGTDLKLGEAFTLPGWRSALGLKDVGDGAVAIAGAILLFALPSRARPGDVLLNWSATSRLPWGLLLLFGGGFALADGFGRSGLSTAISSGLASLEGLPPLAAVTAVCVALTSLTELTSNTATTTLVLPILANVGVAIGLDPRALMIPATLSASCAFMMPVATPPQAIVYGSGCVSIRQMVRAGIYFNVLGVVLVVVLFRLLGGPIFDVDWLSLPEWAAIASR
jgi:solute carrier family 13 (sodium-dependent dicarboxylate transporter), member 2/3/5